MLPPDRGTRNLLPDLIEKQEEIVRAADDGGQVRPVSDPGMSASPSSNPAIDDALPRVGPTHQDSNPSSQTNTASPPQDPSTHSSASSIELNRADGNGGGRMSIEAEDGDGWSGSFSAHGSPSGAPHATASPPGGFSPHPTGDGDTDDGGGDPVLVSESRDTDIPIADPAPAAGAPAEVPEPAGIPIAVPDGDNIHIVQTAFVDQDADVLLNGWMGESKIRVFMDNDADMEQLSDVELDVDGNGRMFLRLNQSMMIDQETKIDLDIYDEDGVLYVDLYVRNEVDIVQDTELDLMMDGWNGPSQFVVNNHLGIRQDVGIDVDIEDELEEKFAIKVAIGVKQAIDVDQDADIDVSYTENGFGFDVDAVQTATIDQDTTLRIDFAVV